MSHLTGHLNRCVHCSQIWLSSKRCNACSTCSLWLEPLTEGRLRSIHGLAGEACSCAPGKGPLCGSAGVTEVLTWGPILPSVLVRWPALQRYKQLRWHVSWWTTCTIGCVLDRAVLYPVPLRALSYQRVLEQNECSAVHPIPSYQAVLWQPTKRDRVPGMS